MQEEWRSPVPPAKNASSANLGASKGSMWTTASVAAYVQVLRQSIPAMQRSRRIKNKLPSAMRSTATELPSESVVKMDGARAKTSQGSSAAARAPLCAPSLHEELTSLCGGGSFMASSDGSHFRSNGNIPVFCSKSWAKVHTNCPACAGFLPAMV